MTKCWACGLLNPDHLKICKDCGRDLRGKSYEEDRQKRLKQRRRKPRRQKGKGSQVTDGN